MIKFSILIALTFFCLILLMFCDVDSMWFRYSGEGSGSIVPMPSPPPVVIANTDSNNQLVTETKLPPGKIWDLSKADLMSHSQLIEREIYSDIESTRKEARLPSLQAQKLSSNEKEIRIWTFVSGGFLSGFTSTNRDQKWVAFHISRDYENRKISKQKLNAPKFGWEKWNIYLNQIALLSVAQGGVRESDPDEGFLVVEVKTGREYFSRIIRRADVYASDSELKELCDTISENFKTSSCGI